MKVVIADYYFEDLENEKKEIARLSGAVLEDYHCKTEDEVIAVGSDADALIVQFAPITRRVIESLRRCKVIVRYAIGVDNIDVSAATDHKIYVANVPDYSIDEVSSHAVTLLLNCVRKVWLFSQDVKRGNWNYAAAKPLFRMEGRTLGLVGLGRIPRLVAKKMGGFGLNIIAYDPYVGQSDAEALGVTLVDFDALVKDSDYISVHCPLNDSTKHLFRREVFQKMKNTAVFVNTARGGVVKEPDLIAALQAGEIASAGLDVFETEPLPDESPLRAMDNVVITPHVGWYSVEAVHSLQQMAAQEVVRVLEGKKPRSAVNKLNG